MREYALVGGITHHSSIEQVITERNSGREDANDGSCSNRVWEAVTLVALFQLLADRSDAQA